MYTRFDQCPFILMRELCPVSGSSCLEVIAFRKRLPSSQLQTSASRSKSGVFAAYHPQRDEVNIKVFPTTSLPSGLCWHS